MRVARESPQSHAGAVTMSEAGSVKDPKCESLLHKGHLACWDQPVAVHAGDRDFQAHWSCQVADAGEDAGCCGSERGRALGTW